MKKKTTIKYVLMLSGLIIFLAGYFLVYMDYSNKTDLLTAEIQTLGDRVDVLEGYDTNIGDYEAGIDGNKAQIGETLSNYYSFETPEDFIMMAKAMEDDIGVTISSLSFEEAGLISDITAVEDMEDYTAPVIPHTLSAYGITGSLDGTMSYSQMKEILSYIQKQDDATSLNAIDLSYDGTTGNIMGSLIINKYYILGRDIEEHKPNVPYTDIGKDVLIGG